MTAGVKKTNCNAAAQTHEPNSDQHHTISRLASSFANTVTITMETTMMVVKLVHSVCRKDLTFSAGVHTSVSM